MIYSQNNNTFEYENKYESNHTYTTKNGWLRMILSYIYIS